MSTLEKIAFYQNRSDEIPNQELARELAASRDQAGIAQIAKGLRDPNPAIQSDCLKVLYEVGYLAPELIAGYCPDFLGLLSSKNNRLVWGSMIALATIASLKPEEIMAAQGQILRTMEAGSVITVDNGVKILAQAAASRPTEGRQLFTYLMHHLETCRAKEVPQHAESIAVAVTAENRAEFVSVLEGRLPEMSEAQARRVEKLIREIEKGR